MFSADTGNMEVLHLTARAAKTEWLEPLLPVRSSVRDDRAGVASSVRRISAASMFRTAMIILNGRKWWSRARVTKRCTLVIFMGKRMSRGEASSSRWCSCRWMHGRKIEDC